MLKRMLTLTLAVGAIHVSATSLAAQGEPREPPPDIVVEVRGLSCPFCAYGIEKKFDERPAVDAVEVAMEEDEVRLWLKPGAELTDAAVRRTVDEAGFTPGEIRRPGSEPEAGGEDPTRGEPEAG